MQEQEPQITPISYHFEVVSITNENKFEEVMNRAAPFHDQLLLSKGRQYRELYKNLEEKGEAVFAVLDDEPRDIAVVEGRLKRVILGANRGEFFVYKRYLRAVATDYQQHGIGMELTKEIVERLQPDLFTGRTPNPYVFRADEKSPYISTIYPIHRLFTPTAERILIATLTDDERQGLNTRTGRCEKVYPGGDPFRLFSLDRASDRVIAIYDIMTGPKIEVNLENGDGIRYLEWVNKHPPRMAA